MKKAANQRSPIYSLFKLSLSYKVYPNTEAYFKPRFAKVAFSNITYLRY